MRLKKLINKEISTIRTFEGAKVEDIPLVSDLSHKLIEMVVKDMLTDYTKSLTHNGVKIFDESVIDEMVSEYLNKVDNIE